MDEDDLEPPKPALSGKKCAHCFEPLPVGVARCPQCRQSTSDMPRSLPLLLALAGIFAAVILAVLVYRTNASAKAEPPPVEQPAPDAFAPVPETSAEHVSPTPAPTSEKPAEPPAPDKKPPLDR